MNTIETLKGIHIPESFSSRKKAKESMHKMQEEIMNLDELEREKLMLIGSVLNHEELRISIDEGKVTLGLIKPRAYEAKELTPRKKEFDDEAAAKIMEIIKEKADVIFQIPFHFNRRSAEEFYGPIKDNVSKEVWQQIMKFMTSGPTTAFLIYDDEGQAVEKWRKMMGATNPENADKDSIRGKYAEKISNNLVHGSDSVESARREIGVLRRIIYNYAIRSNHPVAA